MYPNDFRIFDDGAAELFHFAGCYIPQLAGAKFRVFKFLNERSFYLAVFLFQLLFDDILKDCHNGHSLGTLCPPGRVDLAGMASPQVFGVILKKHGIQLPAETVDIKVFQAGFRFLVDQGCKITESYLHSSQKTKVF